MINLGANRGNQELLAVDSDVRANMFQKLLSEFSKEQREELILEGTEVENERKAKEPFLHNMYIKLMDSDEYIKVEGTKALSGMGIRSDAQGALFAKFLQTSDDATKAGFIAEWKKVRSSKSRRHEFLKNVIAGMQGGDADQSTKET